MLVRSVPGPDPRRDDAAQKVVRLCLSAYARANKVFNTITACTQVLVLPQLSSYQWRVYFVYAAQVFSCDLVLCTIAKVLQVLYEIPNVLLLLSVGALLPFVRSIWNLWMLIPCPPMAELISDAALLSVLAILAMFGVSTFDDTSGFWGIYAFVFAVWPPLVLASMVSRLYVQRNPGRNPFSPLRELPILGLVGAGSQVLMIMAVRELTICDCVVMMCMDPIFAALLSSAMLGKERRRLHFRHVKSYCLIVLLIALYSLGSSEATSTTTTGEAPPGWWPAWMPISYNHALFAVARALVVGRSIFCKWVYAHSNHTTAPVAPFETELIFHCGVEKPRRHRFQQFPAPTLVCLDAIFDSGLRDEQLHGMGPTGTLDLHMLTESTYLLPVTSFLAWIYEQDTLSSGILPAGMFSTSVQTATSIAARAATTDSGEVQRVHEEITSYDVMVALALVALFCVARLLVPWAQARALFDRGSSLHAWKYQPILVAVPFFFFDALWINGALSKFQVCVAVLLALLVAMYRADLWNSFKRKYYLFCTQELNYHQPSSLRKMQKRTLLEFLKGTSTDDYGTLLLETAIHHGGNIGEIARDTTVEIWDPSPSATAAWKLAFSLVTQSLRRQKFLRDQKKQSQAEVARFCGNLVLDMAFNAVDTACGHGGRLRHAGALAKALSKRRALKQLKALAERRKTLRLRRKTGQLATATQNFAPACGVIRPVRDVAPSVLSRSRSSVAQMPSRASDTANGQHLDAQLSLTSVEASPVSSGHKRGSVEEAPLLGVPGELPSDDGSAGERSDEHSSERSRPRHRRGGVDAKPRGVYALAAAAPGRERRPGGSLVVSFGDPSRGQLGLEPTAAARHVSQNTIITVEDLRGVEPLQVEASGVASFVVGGKGQVWGFGSNRSMELGARKEVPQVQAPQRVKSVRGYKAVQIAASRSASGQAHTLMLASDGQVYSFGFSACGALGHGPDVRQTAPILIRMTIKVRIAQVAAGARHSLLVSDAGQLYTVGDNSHGQLGHGRRDFDGAWQPQFVDTPGQVQGPLAEQRVRLLAAGDDHALAATEEGRLFAWGAGANGQLGLSRAADRAQPLTIRKFQDASVISVACGARHSLVVAQRGAQVWSFGSNVQGQLGTGQSSAADGHQVSSPTLCQGLSGRREMEVVQVAAAACHSFAVTRVGEVYAFGDNTYGQLGFPRLSAGAMRQTTTASTAPSFGGAARTREAMELDRPRAFAGGVARLFTPARVVALSLYRVRAVATADMHSLALAA